MNGEAFSVFKSWDAGQLPYVKRHRGRLLRLWTNDNAQFTVHALPEAIRRNLVELRSAERPYKIPHRHALAFEPSDSVPDIQIRPYQADAIQAWIAARCRGIYEMATGTGKTYAALATARSMVKRDGKQALCVLVPYIHLLDQWCEEARKFGYKPVLCSGEHKCWPAEARSKIEDYNVGAIRTTCFIAVHQTAATDHFLKLMKRLAHNTMVVADEVHRLGAGRLRKALSDHYGYRLGLSATPQRWFDDAGTQVLFAYFGGVCYQYTLEQAIGPYLTQYDYYPVLLELTPEELASYDRLTERITTLMHSDRHVETEDALKALLIKRAALIAQAANKPMILAGLLKGMIARQSQSGEEPRHILVYCAPGTHNNILQLVASFGLRCHEFVHTVPLDERRRVLKDFEEGHIQVLVAVKCLDEGVDIPATQIAFVLASSTNPMEFIQRRGRILRKAVGKDT